MQGAADSGEKPQTQSTEPIYDDTTTVRTAMVKMSTVISNKNVNRPVYEEVDQQRFQGPASLTRVPGNGANSTSGYASVPDAIPVGDTVTSVRTPRPPYPPPCLSPEAAMNTYLDGVQDAGYSSPPHRCGSKKARKVRSTRQSVNERPASSVDSSEFV